MIASMKAIDIIYIGQYDLSVSLGIPGQVNHPRILEILDKSVKTIAIHNKMAGCMVHSIGEARKMIMAGFKFIVYQVDSGVLFGALSDFAQGVHA
jgi:2-keto-3-deoxy-L-rhamnonate aldolase RhmA